MATDEQTKQEPGPQRDEHPYPPFGLTTGEAETLIRFAAGFLTRTRDCTYPEEYEEAFVYTFDSPTLLASAATLQELGASTQAAITRS